jgi:acyl-CoA thioester hydrolase
MKIRIYYDDTDSGKIVYHTNYIKYCERARSEIFFSHGEFFESRGFIVKNLNANFLKSAKLGDEIEIKTNFLDLKKSSLKSYQEIFRGDEKIFELTTHLVFMDKWKISKIPNDLLEIIDEYKN